MAWFALTIPKALGYWLLAALDAAPASQTFLLVVIFIISEEQTGQRATVICPAAGYCIPSSCGHHNLVSSSLGPDLP